MTASYTYIRFHPCDQNKGNITIYLSIYLSIYLLINQSTSSTVYKITQFERDKTNV